MALVRSVVACAIACLGCGRIGFEATDDAGISEDASEPSVFAQAVLPAGAAFHRIAIGETEDILYALTTSGRMFRSPDRAVSWQPCGPTPDAILLLAGDPILVGGKNGVLASSDQCATWHGDGLTAPTNALARGNRVIAGTSSGLSVRGSTQWTALPSTFDGLRIATVASRGASILAGSDLGMIASSTDGAAWTTANTGLTQLVVSRVAFGGAGAGRAYAIEHGTSTTPGGVSRSSDGGQTWTEIYHDGGDALATSATDPDAVFASTYTATFVSTNAGASTFDARSPVLELGSPQDAAITSDGRIYLATERGAFEGTLPTPVWQPRFGDLNAWKVHRLAISSDGSLVLAATPAGIGRSTDGGQTFAFTQMGFGRWAYAQDVVFVDATTVLVGGPELRRSTDGGATYTNVYTPPAADSFYIGNLYFDGRYAFVGTGYSGPGFQTRVLVGEAPWTTWQGFAVPGYVHQFATRAGTLLAATAAGLYASTDRATTWQAQGGPVPARCLLVMSDGSTLVGSDDGIWRTSPWTRVGLDGLSVRSLAIRGDALVAATTGGVRVSRDAGASWTRMPGLDDQKPLIVAFDRNGQLLVGTDGYGLFHGPVP